MICLVSTSSVGTQAQIRENHRVAWVGRDLKDHFIPTPGHRQGHLPLDGSPFCGHPKNQLGDRAVPTVPK